MPDPFRAVSPGEPIEFNAVAWNAMLDAARGSQFRTGGDGSPIPSRQATIVNVLNETGSDLTRNSVVGLGDPIFTPTDSVDAFLREVTFRGVDVAIGPHYRRFAILLDPIQDGSVGRAYVAGVCQVKIDIVDHDHRFAVAVDADSAKLRSSHFGPAEILWTETDVGAYGSETGVMWAVVRLGVGSPAIFRAVVTTAIPTGTIGAPSSSGRVTLYINGSAGQTGVTVWNDHTLSSSIGTSKVVKLGVVEDRLYLIAADC